MKLVLTINDVLIDAVPLNYDGLTEKEIDELQKIEGDALKLKHFEAIRDSNFNYQVFVDHCKSIAK